MVQFIQTQYNLLTMFGIGLTQTQKYTDTIYSGWCWSCIEGTAQGLAGLDKGFHCVPAATSLGHRHRHPCHSQILLSSLTTSSSFFAQEVALTTFEICNK